MLRRFIAISLILTLYCFSISAVANSKLNEKQVISLLCNKWKLTTIESKGKKADAMTYDAEITFNFLSNGQLEAKIGAESYNRNWTYNHTKNTVTTTDAGGKEEHTILEISDNTLKMKTKYMGAPVIFEMSKISQP